MPRLENWYVRHSDTHGSPMILVAQIYNSDKFKDGTWVITSHVVEIDWDAGTVQTLNTLYELGSKYHEH